MLRFVIVMAGWLFSAIAVADIQPIPGAGPSTRIVALFAKLFNEKSARHGVKFEVPERSVKHAGGIDASNTLIFGRTGRPLNDMEKSLGKEEIVLGRVPVGFVVGEGAGVRSVTLQQLQDVLMGRVTNWKQIGGADATILRVGREPTEAVLTHMAAEQPFLVHAKWDKVMQRDHQVAGLLASPEGKQAIAFGMLESFSDSSYLQVAEWSSSLLVGLVYDKRNAAHPVVVEAKQFVKSVFWKKELKNEKVGLPAP